MPFLRLDVGILDSSLWADLSACRAFETVLMMAVPYELRQEAAQLMVRSLEPTGFVVPAGWYGRVEAAGVGIVRRAHLPVEEGIAALERLGAPDADSRSSAFDGRRLVRTDGGTSSSTTSDIATSTTARPSARGDTARRGRPERLRDRRCVTVRHACRVTADT